MNLIDSILGSTLAGDASRPALSYRQHRWSYGQLLGEIDRAAMVLAARGVRRGDRVVLFAENRPEHVFLLFGCARLGAVFSPLNIGFRLSELNYVLQNANPCCIFADAAGARALGALPQRTVQAPVFALSDLDRSSRFSFALGEGPDRVVGTAKASPLPSATGAEPVLLLYTSGSTAHPKAVLSTHSAEAWSAAAHRDIWGITHEDRGLVALSLAWAYGLCTVCLSLLSAGAEIDLLPRFHPAAVAETIHRRRSTMLFGVTTMFRMLSAYVSESEAHFDFGSVRFVLSSAESRAPDAFAWVEEKMGVPVFDAYAMSEVRPVFTYDPRAHARPREGSCGHIVPGVRARLVDADGQSAAEGAAGELWVKSPGMFREYYRQPDLMRERVTGDGWYRTGDIMRLDERGFWYFVARATDVIRRGGVNVSPAEVHDVLARHPAVREIAVCGVPDTKYGEQIGVLVVGDFSSDAEALVQLRQFAATNLAEYKLPTVARVASEIPRTATGKPKTNRVRQALAGRVATLQGGPD